MRLECEHGNRLGKGNLTVCTGCGSYTTDYGKTWKAPYLQPAKGVDWKILERLTPQGSEFVNDPHKIYEYLKHELDAGHEARKEVIKLRRLLTTGEKNG